MTPEPSSHSSRPFKVLVTSISAKIPLLRELRKALEKVSSSGLIIGGDQNPICPGRYFVDEFWQMPATEELTINQLIDYCLNQGINAIIPTRDGELRYYAGQRDRLQTAGIAVMVSSPAAIESCLDKLAFYRAVNQLMPGAAIATATELESLGGEAYVVKERRGAGSDKLLLNASKQQARVWAEKLIEPIFQPQISGQEFSIDVYLTLAGKAKGALVRSRDLIVAGEAKISTTVSDRQLEQRCCRLAEQLQLAGHVVFQGIRTEQQFQLIECNARFGGASTLAIAAGLDSFYWFLLETLGEDLCQSPYHRASEELRQVRYPADRILPRP